jgi:hypothetical protein
MEMVPTRRSALAPLVIVTVGLVLTMLDFWRYDGWDLLPDPLGYGLIFVGLTPLARAERRFRTARWIALALMLLSVSTLHENVHLMADFDGDEHGGNRFWAAAMATDIGQVVLIWFLAGGTSELAYRGRDFRLGEHVLSYRGMYLAAALIAMPCDVLYHVAAGHQQGAEAALFVRYYLGLPMKAFVGLAAALIVHALWRTAWLRYEAPEHEV